MNTRETKKNGKRLTGTLAVVLTLAVMVCSAFPNIVSHAEGKDRSQNTPVRITVPDNKVPVYQYGKSQDFVLNIENTGDSEITNDSAGTSRRRFIQMAIQDRLSEIFCYG